MAREYTSEEVARMREALEDLAAHGIHADTMPTMTAGNWPIIRWYDYLDRADKTVREIARRGLSS